MCIGGQLAVEAPELEGEGGAVALDLIVVAVIDPRAQQLALRLRDVQQRVGRVAGELLAVEQLREGS